MDSAAAAGGPLRLEDYGLIGDTETAALVGRDGSIDWLCVPRFDSAACFAALLGDPRNGRWLLAPAGGGVATRWRYRPGTLVLESEWDTPEGTVRVTDAMPARDSVPDVVRVVEGVRGSVDMQMELVVRFDYGSVVPWVRRQDEGLLAMAGPDAITLRSDVETHGEDLTSVARFRVAAGERVAFQLSWHPSHEAPPPALDAQRSIRETVEWWQAWSGRCSHDGPWGDAVRSSLVALKALTYAPTGGIVAAPTTSLPEQIGGVRNWDYRFCWVRDATLTLLALMSGGYVDEAQAWRDWLLRAVAGSPRDLQIMYGPAGERRLPELELDWLAGYEGSVPVRIGNAAHGQRQLDVYGELMDALHQARCEGIESDASAWQVQRALMDFLEGAWSEPDAGLWEMRGPARHFTHSKVMCWVAFDRAAASVQRFGLEGPADRWRACAEEIRREVCERGFDTERRTFTQSYGSQALDAALLLIAQTGFLPCDDERVLGTIAAVQRELCDDGFVLRYPTEEADDGLPPGEGAFLPCTFWLVDALALTGRGDQARALFERLLALRNDLGLLSEEYDVKRARLVGNFPQAFSHVALVDSAVNLAGGRGPAARRGGPDTTR